MPAARSRRNRPLAGSLAAPACNDANGFACLHAAGHQPGGLAAVLRRRGRANAGHPAQLRSLVVYNPPGGAAGIAQFRREFTDLSLNPADPELSWPRRSTALSKLDPRAGDLHAAGHATVRLSRRAHDAREHRNRGLAGLEPGGDNLFDAQADHPVLGGHASGCWRRQPAGSVRVRSSSGLLIRLRRRRRDAAGDGREVHRPLPGHRRRSGQCRARSLITVQSFCRRANAGALRYAPDEFRSQPGVPAIALSRNLERQRQRPGTRSRIFSKAANRTRFSWSKSKPTARPRCASATTPTATTRQYRNRRSRANYRIGNGTAGNVGADSLIYLARRCRASSLPQSAARHRRIDPETNDRSAAARRRPSCHRRRKRRRHHGRLRGRRAKRIRRSTRRSPSLRWTGSWYTVFIAVEPKGGGKLTPRCRALSQKA